LVKPSQANLQPKILRVKATEEHIHQAKSRFHHTIQEGHISQVPTGDIPKSFKDKGQRDEHHRRT